MSLSLGPQVYNTTPTNNWILKTNTMIKKKGLGKNKIHSLNLTRPKVYTVQWTSTQVSKMLEIRMFLLIANSKVCVIIIVILKCYSCSF